MKLISLTSTSTQRTGRAQLEDKEGASVGQGIEGQSEAGGIDETPTGGIITAVLPTGEVTFSASAELARKIRDGLVVLKLDPKPAPPAPQEE